jgi:hypothetical protein
MCDARPASAARPRPRWRRLYAIAALAGATFALTEISVQARPLRIALECGIAVAAWGASVFWIRANRVALDLLDWCDCSAKTITVRVIVSRPAHPESTGATLRVCKDT